MKWEKTAIFLDNYRIYAHHGVMPQERIVGAEFRVSLRVTADCARAIETDRVEEAVDYAALHDIVEKEMAIPSALLEHVAGRIAKHVVQDFPQVDSVEVELQKCNPPMGGNGKGAGIVVKLINDKTSDF